MIRKSTNRPSTVQFAERLGALLGKASLIGPSLVNKAEEQRSLEKRGGRASGGA